MADQQIGNIHGYAAVGGTNRNGGSADNSGLDIDNNDTIAAMRTRLAAIDAGFYTAARLNTMTVNDMEYAIRLNDNAATIK